MKAPIVAVAVLCFSPLGFESVAARASNCVPGAQSQCACPNGGSGVQVCVDDGSRLGSCDCAGVHRLGVREMRAQRDPSLYWGGLFVTPPRRRGAPNRWRVVRSCRQRAERLRPPVRPPMRSGRLARRRGSPRFSSWDSDDGRRRGERSGKCSAAPCALVAPRGLRCFGLRRARDLDVLAVGRGYVVSLSEPTVSPRRAPLPHMRRPR
jgi:hypothetical protein